MNSDLEPSHNMLGSIHKPARKDTGRPAIIFLHGWASSSACWEGIGEALNENHPLIFIDLPGVGENKNAQALNLSDLVSQVVSMLPGQSYVIGWSLGGMLATHIALNWPRKVKALVTIASNLKFVASEDWPLAMKKKLFTDFCNSFLDNSEECLKRFSVLQSKGDKNRREVQSRLSALQTEIISDIATNSEKKASLYKQLCFLEQIDNVAQHKKLLCPGLHIFARNDALVPIDVSAQAFAEVGEQKIKIIEDTGHAPHLGQPNIIRHEIATFLAEQNKKEKYKKNKILVAGAFNKVAVTYSDTAQLQVAVARKLLEFAQSIRGSLLDLGSGTGFIARYRDSIDCTRFIHLDIAEAMLKVARQNSRESGLSSAMTRDQFVCADMDQLPLQSACVDNIVSSMSIQWSNNLAGMFKEANRVLRTGGKFLFSTVGPLTLSELVSAWEQTDDYVHVNRFQSMASIVKCVKAMGFRVENAHTEALSQSYDNIWQIMHSLKDTGVHNTNFGQNPGLTSRKKLRALERAYEIFRKADGTLPVSWEIYYLVLTKK